LSGLASKATNLVISSANGTFIDEAESSALSQVCPEALVYSPKAALGESVGASGLWQILAGAQALLTQQLPPLLHHYPEMPVRVPVGTPAKITAEEAVILDCGLNQQIAGLRLTVKS